MTSGPSSSAVVTDTVLVLRTCSADMTSYGGFAWPSSGEVAAPDWSPAPVCGGGLHGLLWGEGGAELLDWSAEARWLVVEVDAYVVVADKVKFPGGRVVFCGERAAAGAYLHDHGAAGRAIVGGTSTSGDRGASTSGNRGTSTSGNRGTSTSGDRGASTSGYGGASTSGDRGTIEIRWWDRDARRHRTAIAYVGEDGIEPGVAYRLDSARRFVAA